MKFNRKHRKAVTEWLQHGHLLSTATVFQTGRLDRGELRWVISESVREVMDKLHEPIPDDVINALRIWEAEPSCNRFKKCRKPKCDGTVWCIDYRTGRR